MELSDDWTGQGFLQMPRKRTRKRGGENRRAQKKGGRGRKQFECRLDELSLMISKNRMFNPWYTTDTKIHMNPRQKASCPILLFLFFSFSFSSSRVSTMQSSHFRFWETGLMNKSPYFHIPSSHTHNPYLHATTKHLPLKQRKTRDLPL